MLGKAVAYKFSDVESFRKVWEFSQHFVDIAVFDLTPSASSVWDDVMQECDALMVVTDGDPDGDVAARSMKTLAPDAMMVATKGAKCSDAVVKIPQFYEFNGSSGGARVDVLNGFRSAYGYPDWQRVLKGKQKVAVGNQKGGVGKTTIALSIVRNYFDGGGSALYVEVDKQAGSCMVANGITDFQRIFK